MKSKYIFFVVSLFAALSANAQETYENAKLAGEDLNGTARYVGMGGAMEALGADISTIGSNPAVSVCSVTAMLVSVLVFLCNQMVRSFLMVRRLI